MLLRIIDHPATNGDDDRIQIMFQLDENDCEKNVTFTTESYDSPFSSNFHDTLDWYFSEYPQDVTAADGDLGVVSKLIKFGQNIGDEWLGEDHQLIQIVEAIEQNGYQNLQVQLQSERVGFFSELWETAILPDSKYVLSSATRRFTRQFCQDELPPLSFDLKVDLPVNDHVGQLLQGEEPADDKAEKVHKPLRVLYLVSRAKADDLPFTASNAINTSLQAMSAGGATDYEIHQNISWQQLQDRLNDAQQPVHVVHYDGPVMVQDGQADIALNDETQISADDFCKVLADNNVAALCVDARAYLNGTESVGANEGLATVALAAHQQGLGNVIGLGQTTNPWTSATCFNVLYDQIAKGLSLDTAVVEARKALQSVTETALVTIKPVPFHASSLLVHYGRQPVTFFAADQAPADPQAPPKTLINDKLFGFQNKMLPPLLNQVSDGQALSLIEHLNGDSPAVALTGQDGIGKTQLAHVASVYLAEKQLIDFGFYFDFGLNNYSTNDMLEMVAPILSLSVEDKTAVAAKLEQLHCCFVLDDVESADDSLQAFVENLIAKGHKVILLAEQSLVEKSMALLQMAATQMEVQPLSLLEQKILAVQSVRDLNLGDMEQSPSWEVVLTQLQGHPWLSKKLMPQLASVSGEQLINDITKHIQSSSKVDDYYQWQWSTLPVVWQKLLVMASDVPGLLLEMLMIACQQQQPFAPAKALFELLGDSDAEFSQGLGAIDGAGFLSRFPHGRLVDSRCLRFLQAQRESAFAGIDTDALQLPFSQLLSEGVRILSQHVVKQQNPNISNNLLLNRRHWVKHFETLWFNKDYRGFIGVKNAFDQLLQQVKLGHESRQWALQLLERSPMVETGEGAEKEAQLSWLAVAVDTLGLPETKNNECIGQGVERWRQWFDGIDESIETAQLPLFQQVVTFLDQYYFITTKWHDAIEVCEKSNAIYTRYKAWQRVIQSLKSLARYHMELGENDQALAFENQILNDIPYDDAPQGFKTQQMIDVLMARLARSEITLAQNLLDEIRKADDSDKMADMLDGIQCDIHFQQENYEAALPHYCKIWPRVLQSNQPEQIEHLRSRLQTLEQKLGADEFNAVFEKAVPAGADRP